eukprot:4777955-Amphidinium_carterae.1
MPPDTLQHSDLTSYAQPSYLPSNASTIVGSISIDQSTPSLWLEKWAIMVDTGSMVNIAPPSFCQHVPTTPHQGDHGLTAVTGNDIKIYGVKKLTLLINASIIIPVEFIIAD